METPHQTIGRLLTAVEALTREEEFLFEQGQYVESTAVQQRSMPLVRKIAELLVGPNIAQTLEPGLQTRIQTLLQNRQSHYDHLSARLEATQQELDKISAAQALARRMRPVYREPAAASFAAEG
jgi:hypothetical protein